MSRTQWSRWKAVVTSDGSDDEVGACSAGLLGAKRALCK